MARHKATKRNRSYSKLSTPPSNQESRHSSRGDKHSSLTLTGLMTMKNIWTSPILRTLGAITLTGALLSVGMSIPHSNEITTPSPSMDITRTTLHDTVSRSKAREDLNHTSTTQKNPSDNANTDRSDAGSISSITDSTSTSIGKVTGSWTIGESNDNLHVPYSKTPLEKVQDVMKSQTAKDLDRLRKSDRHADGFGTSKTTDNDLPLTKTMMAELGKSYKKLRPSGFNPNHDTGDKGNAYSFSQCTWWAYVRRHQLGLPAGSYMGDGRMWASTARSLGYWVDRNPMVGDVIVFQPGQAGADGYYGHVGVVENVIELDGKKWVVTSESSAEYNGKHFSRILSDVERFEYIHS